MLIRKRNSSPIDSLWILWSLCLIKHYQDNNKVTSPNNIITEFGERNWRMFRIACEMADRSKFLNYSHMQLTPKGLAACERWQAISNRIYSI